MKKHVLLLVFVIVAVQAWGLNLEPLSTQFSPSGRNSIRTFRVSNTQDQSIAVRILMTTRELQPDGSEVREPADAEFTVFPNRLFLAPGQTQAVRVQWRGDQQLTRERAYRIIVEQVAVEDETRRGSGEDGGLSLNFMYRYVGAVYITPPNAQAGIVLRDAQLQTVSGSVVGVTVLALEFENQGTGHAIVQNAEVTIRARTPNGTPVEYILDSEQLGVLSGVNFLAGARLTQLVAMPEPVDEDSIEVQHSIRVLHQ